LAGVYALITASRRDGYEQPKLKDDLVRWSAKWLTPSFLLMPLAFLWYLNCVPAGQRQLLNFGISTIGQGTFTQVTRAATVTVMTSGTIVAFVYFTAWRNTLGFTLGRALTVLFLALAATASTEHAREMLRKPYVVGDHMFSNGVRRNEVERFNREGYLTGSMWLDSGAATPAARTVSFGETDAQRLDELKRGEMMFRGQCLACHTTEGYRPIVRLMQGRDRKAIDAFLKTLYEYKPDSPYRAFMPPLVGTQNERDALAFYLDALVNAGAKRRPAASVAQK
jgi:mono/diheme cytochrome c family protein